MDKDRIKYFIFKGLAFACLGGIIYKLFCLQGT